MIESRLGELAALGTVFCWTITGFSFEAAGKRIGSLSVNLIRLVLAGLFLILLGYIRRGLPFPTDATAHAWLWLSISGLIGFGIGDLCLFRAFILVGARVSMLVMALVPPITAVVGRLFLAETLLPRDWLGMALTVGGVIWVVMERPAKKNGEQAKGVRSMWGVCLALGAAGGQAVGLVLSKYGMGDYDAFAATEIRVFAGIAGFAILFTLLRRWKRAFAATRKPLAMRFVALGTLFGPVLGVSLSLLAVQHTETGVAATIIALVPVVIIVPSVLIFKEKISLRAIMGACLAVAGAAVLFLG
jgi:drug/metabolite transporter (DMT)-like permease